ncbi:MAG: type I-C CRISPR-associated protein Cas8c/Csd1 [Verrucomicrobia bacterium]|nr:type I-C CRISPR-associated protein Cas8c/Csd1 [Verrucomicrobiota bacterium]
MLLKHLYDFAISRKLLDDLAFRRDTPVRWIIHLDASGNLVSSGPQETEGPRRNKGLEYSVPKTSRATNSGTVADFLVDDIGAIFCLITKPEQPPNERAVAKLKAKHDDFWRQIREAKQATGDSRFNALLGFQSRLEGKAPPFLRIDEKGGNWLVKTASDIEKPLGSDMFSFAVSGTGPLFLDEKVREHWSKVHAAEMQETEEESLNGLCMVTGDTGVPLARTHTPMVTGLPKPAKGTGAGIVGFESPAFRSYGFEKSYNAPTSVVASKAYLLALQFLSKREDHWLTLGPAWLCFWAAQSDSASSLFARLLNRPDTLTVRRFMTSPWAGIEKPPADTEKFFAVTLTAAGPRIIVKEWVQATVAEAADHFHQWFADLELSIPQRPPAKTKPAGEEREFHPLSVYWLARSTVREAKNLAPEIPTQLYRAALEGTAPSLSLLTPILNQLHSKLVRDENYQILYDESRFALLKLILNRNRKNTTMQLKPELTADTDDPAYNCGRLLAILAVAQDKAHDYKLEGAGVAERYFGTASSSPGSVFPLLLRLNRHHLDKISKSNRFAGRERFIGEQIQGVCALFRPAKPGLPPMFPRTLDLQAQGRFALGFYQQMAADTAARRPGPKNDDASSTDSETK